jgi:hypothetical protein
MAKIRQIRSPLLMGSANLKVVKLQRSPSDQGCQILFCTKYQNGGKHTKLPQNDQSTIKIPNGRNIFQIGIKYTNINLFKALQNLPKSGVLFLKYTIWQPCIRCRSLTLQSLLASVHTGLWVLTNVQNCLQRLNSDTHIQNYMPKLNFHTHLQNYITAYIPRLYFHTHIQNYQLECSDDSRHLVGVRICLVSINYIDLCRIYECW